ncbi:hypothetical protein O6H91_12G101700 [Diphasiastrum complanatum]|uniref:Uncharacterized protein n=1 Tax=Diphasiastrum complanatum TaxID=34168 RepID=A0ACC2C581_DIPCM|nr:hypothetical protein O6H91_12G101700 [Diphasiastrum complanatum]
MSDRNPQLPSSRTNPKVVRLSDPYDVASSTAFAPSVSVPVPGGGGAAKAGGYEPLRVLGAIREKGFQKDARPVRISAPEPRVTPFPVARHRSEGPHWAPVPISNVAGTREAEEDGEDSGAESVSRLAQPLQRKIKSGLQLGTGRVEQELSKPKATVIELGDEKPTPAEGVVESVPKQARVYSSNQHDTSAKKLTRETPSKLEGVEDVINAENLGRLQDMSETEIAEAQAELLRRLRPEVVDMLKRRGAAKDKKMQEEDQQEKLKPIVDKDVVSEINPSSFSFPLEEADKMITSVDSQHGHSPRFDPLGKDHMEDTVFQKSLIQAPVEINNNIGKSWTQRVEDVRLKKFDFNGNIISSNHSSGFEFGSSASEKPETYHNVAERDFLRSEGDPAREGYSLKEATTLVRSTVPGQRAAALQLIASILDRALMGLQNSTFQEICGFAESGLENDADWQAIWAYALGPEPQLGLTLRLALDDSHATVVAACGKALQALLSCSSNEYYFHLLETFWSEERTLATAPIFRKRTKQEEGFIGGGRWKYNVKPSNLHPFQGKPTQEMVEEEGNSTVGDDSAVINQDVAAGLIRMGILPRIRYIIEVEQLVVVEEHLMNVLIALARHSPQAAEMVMKCPRLIEAVTQRFLLNNDRSNTRACLVCAKAIQLLKILAQASRATCICFAESGALQVAMSDLFRKSFSAAPTGVQGSFGGLTGTLSEALRLWRVCIKYEIGISLFSDLYPALCFWLSPPSPDYSWMSSEDDDMFCLAQESYLLLGELARTLPVLHALSKGNGSQAAESEHLCWSWSVALPMVETSFGWLSSECTSFFKMLGCLSGNSSSILTNNKISMKRIQYFIGALHAVFNFLSVVCERVSSGKDHLEMPKGSVQASNTYQPFWLPAFIPQLGLHVAASNLLGFHRSGTQSKNANPTLVDWILNFKEAADPETLLVLVSCMHALIRLAHSIDTLLEVARPEVLNVSDKEQLSVPQVTLRSGILLSAENELQGLLEAIGNQIIGNQLLQASESNGRGGPAPGVGLGWGSKYGGAWSIQTLLAQKYALLTTDLLLFLPRRTRELYEDQSADWCRVPNYGEIARIKWRFDAGLAAMMVAGPGKAHLLEKVLSDVLLNTALFSSIVRSCQSILKTWAKHRESKDGSQTASNETVLMKSNIQQGRDILLQHFKTMWLLEKSKLDKEDATHTNESGTKSLATIPEDSPHLEDDSMSCRAARTESQMAEWAGARLPLPNHWFLSPLSTDLTQHEIHSISIEDNCNMDEGEQNCMENLIRSGLVLLLGLETIMDQVKDTVYSGVSRIPLVRKIHALSTLFVLGGDVFLQHGIRELIGAFQDFLGFELDEASTRNIICKDSNEKLQLRPRYIETRCQKRKIAAEPYILEERHTREASTETSSQPFCAPSKIVAVDGKQGLDFELFIDSSYVNFAESLAETFAASSFGDLNFGCQVAIYFRREVAESIRLAIWRVLADAKVLELLPSLESCIGSTLGYLYPAEDAERVLETYVSAWTSGTLERAADRHSLPFTLALHHIAAFIFKLVDNTDLQRKKFVRNLVRASARRKKQQIMLLQLLSYGLRSTHKNCSDEPPFLDPSAKEFQDLESRLLLLFEACTGDQGLLAEVQNLQKLLPQYGLSDSLKD